MVKRVVKAMASTGILADYQNEAADKKLCEFSIRLTVAMTKMYATP